MVMDKTGCTMNQIESTSQHGEISTINPDCKFYHLKNHPIPLAPIHHICFAACRFNIDILISKQFYI